MRLSSASNAFLCLSGPGILKDFKDCSVSHGASNSYSSQNRVLFPSMFSDIMLTSCDIISYIFDVRIFSSFRLLVKLLISSFNFLFYFSSFRLPATDAMLSSSPANISFLHSSSAFAASICVCNPFSLLDNTALRVLARGLVRKEFS